MSDERISSTRIGKTVAGYRLESLLGRGGMSVVYLAEHMRLGRKVALKLLASPLSGDESFRERFERESRRAAEIDHPNIIPIFDAGEEEGELFIAMRYVEGSDLKTLIARDGGLNVGRAMFILEQTGAALDAAHERDLVHRDVKPANILIEQESDRVYVTDFGVVKHTGTRGSTQTGFFVGTADYSAPEQIEGMNVDRRADVYALGCVLYEMLVGRPPFDREAEVAVMHAHLTELPPKVTDSRQGVAAAIDGVVERAMAKQRDERYASCSELVSAARAAVLQQPAPRGDQAGVTAARPVPAPDAETEDATFATSEQPELGPASAGLGARFRSAPGWVIGLGTGAFAALAALVAVVVVLAVTNSDDPTAGPVASPPASAASSEEEPVESNDPAGETSEDSEPSAAPEPDNPPAPPADEPTPEPAGDGGGSGAGDGSGDGAGDGSGDGAGDGSGGDPPAVEPATGGTGDGTGSLGSNADPAETLEAVIPPQLFRDCVVPAEPSGAAFATASCTEEDRGGLRFSPDTIEVSVFATGRELDEAYAAALAALPNDVRPTEDEGRCNGTRWGGEGDWEHGPGRPGGGRFCAFDDDDALLVWSHRKFGQDDHVNALGIVREGGANHARLFDWWRFWVHRIGLTS
ncbi:MAG: serine/threonine-protein kinase [Gaiellaceae bacterium]